MSITLRVERDSVCAGDDADAPHEKHFRLSADATLADTISVIIGEKYLASIAGGMATWIVESNKSLAVVAQQWDSPRFLVDWTTPIVECVPVDASKRRFFRYWCQVDPTTVVDCLQAGRSLPSKYGTQ
jgi:hypothetical protein